VVGALLAGIVALNVAALGMTTGADRLDTEIQRLETENAQLVSQLAGGAATARIEKSAARLGLVAPAETRYLELDPRVP
jgi:hypothetical protein